jgi:hypothetical protein
MRRVETTRRVASKLQNVNTSWLKMRQKKLYDEVWYLYNTSRSSQGKGHNDELWYMYNTSRSSQDK